MATPASFLCSITHQVMKDPVIDGDGNSFERVAIEKWLAANGTSPVTRLPMTLSDLRPNRALKELIDSKVITLDPEDVTEGSVSLGVASQEPVYEDPDIDVVCNFDGNNIHLCLQPGNGNKRVPVDICCVIDKSGSMNTETEIKTQEGQVERNGLTVLDVVKHAVKTIIESLGDQDRISIVSFSDAALVELDVTPMTVAGKARAQAVVEGMCASGCTNLWDGLKTGVNLVQNSNGSRLKFVYLLTDGLPTMEPPRGHIQMMHELVALHENNACIVNTFGFGYSLDSSLLNELASIGGGQYAYIPDAALVGTVFIHAISNALCTVAKNVTCVVESNTGDKIVVKVPSIQIGQNRDMVVSMQQQVCGGAVTIAYGKTSKTVDVVDNGDKASLQVHKLRNAIAQAVLSAVSVKKANPTQDVVSSVLKEVISTVKGSFVVHHPHVQAMLTDLEGEISMAFSDKYFSRWGKHYLLSIATAYNAQQCNNFKDPGVQIYGGNLFKSIRSDVDNVFNNLPPPKPSVVRSGTAPVVSMSVYNNANGVCFDGDCLVTMLDGTQKKVYNVKRGDVLQSGATVMCVTMTPCGGYADLVCFANGLRVTPWHPIQDQTGNWVFPYHLMSPTTVKCNAVYNFILDKHHMVVVNGVKCVTLGHGLTNEVCAHPFFGTTAVVENIMTFPTFDTGKVVIRGAKRDTVTGLVNGFEPYLDW